MPAAASARRRQGTPGSCQATFQESVGNSPSGLPITGLTTAIKYNMLPVNSMKLEEDHFLLGAASAVIAGGLVVFIDGFEGVTAELLGVPALVVLGTALAAAAGGVLASKVVRAPIAEAVGVALFLGAAVPIVTGAIAVPLIGAIGGPAAWPATVPSGLLWMVAVRRLAGLPARPDQVLRGGLALGLSLVLLAIRSTQPTWYGSSSELRCVSFPGEHISSLAWSPDARWLGIGSSVEYREGIVRVLDPLNGKVVELARGAAIETEVAGLAVGPGGVTAYLNAPFVEAGPMPGEDVQGAPTLLIASPAEPPRVYAELSTQAIANLLYTTDGIAGLQWFDPDTQEVDVNRPVWIDEGATASDRLREVTSAEVARNPILSPLVRPEAKTLTVMTPSGSREILRPDAFDGLTVTRDGRATLYVNTHDAEDENRDEVVALSTETGRKQVLTQAADADDPVVEDGWLAYRTAMASTNRVCLMPVELDTLFG
jgi:hypothetical protein